MRFGLQLGGRICLHAVRALAGFLCDVDRRNAVASQLRSHRLDAPVQDARAPDRVARDLGPSVDVDERDRLRRGAGGGVDDHLPADHGQGRPPPGRLIEIVALDLRRRRASGERGDGDEASGRSQTAHPCQAATVFSAEKP